MAVAHARLVRVLAGAATTFGVYARSPASSLQVLADLRVLSARMLASIDPEDLDDFLEMNGGSSIRARVLDLDLDPRRWGKPAVFTARAPALITGIGIALALAVLGCESIHEAGDRLRSVIGRRGARNRTATPGELRFGHLSPALEAVHLSAISGHFTPVEQVAIPNNDRVSAVPARGQQRPTASLCRPFPPLCGVTGVCGSSPGSGFICERCVRRCRRCC